MKRLNIFIRVALLLPVSLGLSGCLIYDLFPSYCGLGGDGTGSISVQTFYTANGINLVDTNVHIAGFTQAGVGQTTQPCNGLGVNSQLAIDGFTNSTGIISQGGVCIQSDWTFTRYPTAGCNRLYTYDPIYFPSAVDPAPLYCGLGGHFVLGPIAYDSQYPQTMIATGLPGDFSGTYGAPLVAYISPYGVILGYASALGVSADGSQVQIAPSYFSSAYDGAYSIIVSNVQEGGSMLPSDGFTVNVFNNPAPPPPSNDPPPCTGDLLCVQ